MIEIERRKKHIEGIKKVGQEIIDNADHINSLVLAYESEIIDNIELSETSVSSQYIYRGGLNCGIGLAGGLYEGLVEKSKPVLEGEIE